MKGFAVLLLTLLLVLVAAVPASAAPPDIERGEFDIYARFEDLTGVCGFDIWGHAVASWQLTTFYDNEHNAIGIRYSDHGTIELTAPGTSDVRLTGNWTAIILEDYVTGRVYWPGNWVSVTVPGYGPVWKDSGLWRNPPAGPLVGIHTSFDPEKMALLCRLLSGG